MSFSTAGQYRTLKHRANSVETPDGRQSRKVQFSEGLSTFPGVCSS